MAVRKAGFNTTDLPLIGRDKAKEQLFSTALYAAEAMKVSDNANKWEQWRKVEELRKSCGVEYKPMTINVRVPPRYKGVT